MKIIKSLLDSFRLSMTIPAALLVHVGFVVSHQTTNWPIVIAIFFAAGATMLQNDYFDREHDLKKDKDFTFKNQKLVKRILYVLWGSLSLFAGFLYYQSPAQSILLFVCISIGILYSFSRTVLLLPALLVAATSSSPLLFSFVNNGSLLCVFLFLSVFFIISGREIIKDIEDQYVDCGYKKTLLTEKILNEKNALKVAACLVLIGSCMSLFVWGGFAYHLSGFLYLCGLFFCIGSAVLLFFTDNWNGGRNILDKGTMCIILSLLLRF